MFEGSIFHLAKIRFSLDDIMSDTHECLGTHRSRRGMKLNIGDLTESI